MFRLLRLLLILAVAAAVAAGVALYRLNQDREHREIHAAEELAPRTGHFLQAADVRLFVQEAGPASGPAVVLVPGPGLWSESWREPMVELAGAGYHAIALDLPPFGFSQRPDPSAYDKRHQALRIIGALDTLHIERAVLVGHSFGAGPVVEAAIVAPQRVSALLLVDAALEIRTRQRLPPTRLSKVSDFLARNPLEREWLVSGSLTDPILTRPLLQLLAEDSASASAAWVQQVQAPLGIRGTTEAVDDWLATMLIKDSPGFGEYQFAYPWLKLPIVLIWGRQDRIAPLEQAELIHQLAPQSRLVVLDGVGHLPMMEKTEEFSRQVRDALTSVSQQRSRHSR